MASVVTTGCPSTISALDLTAFGLELLSQSPSRPVRPTGGPFSVFQARITSGRISSRVRNARGVGPEAFEPGKRRPVESPVNSVGSNRTDLASKQSPRRTYDPRSERVRPNLCPRDQAVFFLAFSRLRSGVTSCSRPSFAARSLRLTSSGSARLGRKSPAFFSPPRSRRSPRDTCLRNGVITSSLIRPKLVDDSRSELYPRPSELAR